MHLLGVDAARGEETLGESLEEYLDDIGDVCVVHGTVESFDEKSWRFECGNKLPEFWNAFALYIVIDYIKCYHVGLNNLQKDGIFIKYIENIYFE